MEVFVNWSQHLKDLTSWMLGISVWWEQEHLSRLSQLKLSKSQMPLLGADPAVTKLQMQSCLWHNEQPGKWASTPNWKWSIPQWTKEDLLKSLQAVCKICVLVYVARRQLAFKTPGKATAYRLWACGFEEIMGRTQRLLLSCRGNNQIPSSYQPTFSKLTSDLGC